MGEKNAFFLSIIKVIFSSLLFGGFSGFLFSISGALLSFLFMVLGINIFKLSIMGTSILGGVFHNIGQLLAFAVTVDTFGLTYYLPVLIISGVCTGAITGIISSKVIERLSKYNE